MTRNDLRPVPRSVEGLVEGVCVCKHTVHNQPLNNWNVSNVKNMAWMFEDASSFNQPLHAPWYQGDLDLDRDGW